MDWPSRILSPDDGIADDGCPPLLHYLQSLEDGHSERIKVPGMRVKRDTATRLTVPTMAFLGRGYQRTSARWEYAPGFQNEHQYNDSQYKQEEIIPRK